MSMKMIERQGIGKLVKEQKLWRKPNMLSPRLPKD